MSKKKPTIDLYPYELFFCFTFAFACKLGKSLNKNLVSESFWNINWEQYRQVSLLFLQFVYQFWRSINILNIWKFWLNFEVY